MVFIEHVRQELATGEHGVHVGKHEVHWIGVQFRGWVTWIWVNMDMVTPKRVPKRLRTCGSQSSMHGYAWSTENLEGE